MFVFQRFLEWLNKAVIVKDKWGYPQKRRRFDVDWFNILFWGFWALFAVGIVFFVLSAAREAAANDLRRTQACVEKYGPGAKYYQLDISDPALLARAESYGIVVPPIAKEEEAYITTCQDVGGNIKQYPGRYDD